MSRIVLSKWNIKDQKGYGTRRGRLQIRTAQITAGRLDKYKVSIVNDSILQPLPTDSNWLLIDGVWDDTAVWEDTAVWTDAIPFFERVYYDDEKITVASNADTTFIVFSNNDLHPSAGFKSLLLNTINVVSALLATVIFSSS